jgi:ribosomal protein S18 acetylase RimI-like enzyme
MRKKVLTQTPPNRITADDSLKVHPLATGEEAEVLHFLAARPLHTVTMSGFVRDNGLISPLNRGCFYSCRNRTGKLEGVALIGHTTLFESQTETATKAFARVAQDCQQLHLLMGEHDKVQCFWGHYAQDGESPRLRCPVLLLEQRKPFKGCEPVEGLRPATPDDLEAVMLIQAELLCEQSGVNPLELDPVGFRRRCARRIEQRRAWAWMKDGKVIFKADIIAETPKSVYVEGVYVSPQERGKGYGRRCLSQLGQSLLRRTASICLFADKQDRRAQDFYRSVGYEFSSSYDLLYFNRKEERTARAS